MSNTDFIGAALLGGFFIYVTLTGTLRRYVDLLLGASGAVAATPVTGVSDVNAAPLPSAADTHAASISTLTLDQLGALLK